MKITIVNGFFLPVPPISGGSTEKTWFALGREFAARGHEIVSISREWTGYPSVEKIGGVTYRRLPGHDHRSQLWKNLLHDFAWSWRVFRALPPADIVICNAVALPMWLGRWSPSSGRVVVMCGRMPKGQYRRYRALSRVLAPSGLVRERLMAENPALANAIRVTGYPIDWSQLSLPQPEPASLPPRVPGELTIGFVGRIHSEKGLMLLADAAKILAMQTDLPPWRVLLCGPADVARGGSGAGFRSQLLQRLSLALPGHRFHLLDPQFNDRILAAIYQRMDVFCYPSLAAEGETFGVAVAEAMASGAVPVVSNLACFQDLVCNGANGFVFDHTPPDAAARLAQALAQLLRDEPRRRALAAQARADVQCYDFPRYADSLLQDFATLLPAP